MKLSKEQKIDFLKHLRGIYKLDVGNEQDPDKFHNDIELGPGGDSVSIGINESLRKAIRKIIIQSYL